MEFSPSDFLSRNWGRLSVGRFLLCSIVPAQVLFGLEVRRPFVTKGEVRMVVVEPDVILYEVGFGVTFHSSAVSYRFNSNQGVQYFSMRTRFLLRYVVALLPSPRVIRPRSFKGRFGTTFTTGLPRRKVCDVVAQVDEIARVAFEVRAIIGFHRLREDRIDATARFVCHPVNCQLVRFAWFARYFDVVRRRLFRPRR